MISTVEKKKTLQRVEQNQAQDGCLPRTVGVSGERKEEQQGAINKMLSRLVGPVTAHHTALKLIRADLEISSATRRKDWLIGFTLA